MIKQISLKLQPLIWFFKSTYYEEVIVFIDNIKLILPTKQSSQKFKTIYCERELHTAKTVFVATWIKSFAPHLIYSKTTMLDIGSGIGETSIAMNQQHLFDEYIAIEPDPTLFKYVQENIQQNGLTKTIKCIQSTVGTYDGYTTLYKNIKEATDNRIMLPFSDVMAIQSWPMESVKQMTLESLLSQCNKSVDKIGLIFIDIFGRELSVFSQAQSLLRHGPIVCTSFSPKLIQEAGFSAQEYAMLAQSIWPFFYIIQEKNYVPHSSISLYDLFEHLGYDGESIDLLFIPAHFCP